MLLKDLTALSGPSGHENEVRDALRAQAMKLGAQVKCDTMGNVIAHKPGTDSDKPHIMLAAHMDEVGFIVKSATDDGLLRMDCVGGIDPRVIVSKRVLVGDKKIKGVIGAMAIHLQSREDMERVLGYDGLYIDIGAKDKAEAQQLAPVGTYVIFDSDYVEFGKGLVKARALDDRVGCLTLLQVLKKSTYTGDITCVFTVQEEVGLRGAQIAAHRVAPDIAFVLEGTASNDLGDVKSDTMKVTRVGEGVAISFMDRASIADKNMLAFAIDTAKKEDIAWQYKQLMTGGNDAGAIQQSRGGVRTLTLSVPCRYIHSPSSVASLSDIAAQQALVLAMLERLNTDCPFEKTACKA